MGEPWLVGSGEIGERLGLSRRRVQQLAERDDFPTPFAGSRMGRIRWRQEVEIWTAGWRGRAGDRCDGVDCRQLAGWIADCLAAHGLAFIEDDEIEELGGVLRQLLSAAGIRGGAGCSG